MKGIDKTSKLNRYICDKFGDDCETALAVVHAENGAMDEKLISKPNRNGTRDHGCWQLNDAYYVSQYDCFKDTDTAYEIYKAWGGFHAWSAYNNKSYHKFLTLK